MVTCAKSAVQHVSELAHNLGMLAKWAMLEEVYTTPKPGLVDCYSNGAHKDMEVSTFQNSAAAITPFLIQMAETGAYASDLNKNTFARIRTIGIEAEKAMYLATNGVNTHKGMIFSLGIFVTAAAFCRSHGYRMTENTLFFQARKLVADTLSDEMKLIKNKESVASKGELLFKHMGITGIRGEAVRGYKSVRKIALPVLTKGLAEEKNYNLVKLQVLFALMSEVEDSNVVARRGNAVLKQVQKYALEFLESGGAYEKAAVSKLRQMDKAFIKENISCGGCADLLAVTIFVYSLISSDMLPASHKILFGQRG